MRLPKNGSISANVALVGAGALLGAVATWCWLGVGGPAAEDSRLAGAGRPETVPPARRAALARRVDGRPAGDPVAAVAVNPAGLPAGERAEHFRRAGAAAAGRDLHAALAEASTIGSRQDQLEFYRGVYKVWSELDPEGALAHAQANFPAGQLQSDTIGIAMNKWGQDHPREAWLWAEGHLSGPLKDRALTDLVIGWTHRSPQEAADWLAETGLTSQPLFNALPGAWAESDPLAAAAWVAALPAGKAKETAEVAVASTVALDDPLRAAELYAGQLADGEHLNLAIAITDIWATTDPAATAEWIAGLPEGAARTEAAATLATVWAASDIRAAVEWSAGLTDPSVRQQVITHIGTTWGAIEPEAALGWLNSLPPAEAGNGITGAFYSWAGTDPVGLREWIDRAPADAAGDLARQSLGDVLSQQNLPDALDLALGMNSPVARDEALARYFREWRKVDDGSAQDWLDANWSSLPGSARQRLATEQARLVVPK